MVLVWYGCDVGELVMWYDVVQRYNDIIRCMVVKWLVSGKVM